MSVSTNTAMNSKSDVSNNQTVVEVGNQDLPLHYPMPGSALWNSHPRVFLPITDAPDGRVECPYCGTQYVLKGGNASGH